MRIHKTHIWLFFSTLCLAAATATAALQSKNLIPAQQKQQGAINQIPIADASEPESKDPVKIAKRKAKSKKYDQYNDIGPGISAGQRVYHWPPGFPTLPISQSDAVVIGDITDASATLTEDKAAVYSEFSVSINEVVKNDTETPLSIGVSIVVDRPGGRVRYPTGHISQFTIAGWGMPKEGSRYVLFLKRGEQDYQIITGYELREGRVYPLDRTTSSDTDFNRYINAEEIPFLKKLRAAAVSNTSSLK
jgi:hypothetical protein